MQVVMPASSTGAVFGAFNVFFVIVLGVFGVGFAVGLCAKAPAAAARINVVKIISFFIFLSPLFTLKAEFDSSYVIGTISLKTNNAGERHRKLAGNPAAGLNGRGGK